MVRALGRTTDDWNNRDIGLAGAHISWRAYRAAALAVFIARSLPCIHGSFGLSAGASAAQVTPQFAPLYLHERAYIRPRPANRHEVNTIEVRGNKYGRCIGIHLAKTTFFDARDN